MVLLIAGGGFIGAGKKNEAAGRYEVCLLSRSLCEPALRRPFSLSLRATLQPEAHYQCVDQRQSLTLCSVRESLTS